MNRAPATRHGAAQLQASPDGFGTAHCHQPKGASICGASRERRKSQDFPAWLAGAQWSGMPRWTHSLAAEWPSPPQKRSGGLFLALQSKECFVPSLPPGAELWDSQTGPARRELSSQPKATWGLSSMSQGHLLEIPLRSNTSQLGFATLASSSGTPPAHSPLLAVAHALSQKHHPLPSPLPSPACAASQSFVDPPTCPRAEQSWMLNSGFHCSTPHCWDE